MIYQDETGKTVKASNYQEAAEKLYGQGRSIDGNKTTYAHRRRNDRGDGWADVNVWQEGDKIGSYYGVQASRPAQHTLRRMT